MKDKIFSVKKCAFGLIIGAVNGFFGAGGGIVCVELLRKLDMPRKKAHSNAVAIIFFITLVSATSYFVQGKMQIADSLIYIPGGLIGAVIGTAIMKKISPKIIKKIFAIFMIWAGWRLMF